MRCILVRHAESTANREARLQGRADFPLSEAGYRQAEQLYRRFSAHGPAATHVYASPLERARESARVAARAWALPIEPWDDLQEYDVGVFSRLTWPEIRARFPDAAQQFERTHDWDGVAEAETVQARCERGRRVADTLMSRHGDDDVVVLFTHGGILQHILAALLGTNRTWGVTSANTAVFDFVVNRARWRDAEASAAAVRHFHILAFNDSSHLERAGDEVVARLDDA